MFPSLHPSFCIGFQRTQCTVCGRTGTRSVVPPGGFGTLDDLVETLTWHSSGCTRKLCGLLNVADYVGRLIALLDHAFQQQLHSPVFRGLLLPQPDTATLLERMHGDTPSVVETRSEFRLAVTPAELPGREVALERDTHRSSTSPSNCARASGASAGRLGTRPANRGTACPR